MFSDLVDGMDDMDGYSIEPNFFLDVPFVPTDDAVIAIMLRLGEVTRDDTLYDLGAGDGRIVIAAAKKFGTQCIGVELDPLRISEAMEEAAHERVEHLVDFVEGDIFEADFSEATVVMLYLMDSINALLRPRLLQELRPGTRIVSHAFDMGDWKPDTEIPFSGIAIYKWVVPAKVEGVWAWEGPEGEVYHVELRQKYQVVTGEAWVNDELVVLQEGRVDGKRLTLVLQRPDRQALSTVVLVFSGDAAYPTVEWA